MTALRTAATALIILVAGLWGMVIMFSDYPSHWSEADWLTYVLGCHALAGVLIGLLNPGRWYLSLAATWGAMLMGGLFLLPSVLSSISGPPEGIVETTDERGSVVESALWFAGILGVTAVGGYAGAMLSRGLRRLHRSGPTQS